MFKYFNEEQYSIKPEDIFKPNIIIDNDNNNIDLSDIHLDNININSSIQSIGFNAIFNQGIKLFTTHKINLLYSGLKLPNKMSNLRINRLNDKMRFNISTITNVILGVNTNGVPNLGLSTTVREQQQYNSLKPDIHYEEEIQGKDLVSKPVDKFIMFKDNDVALIEFKDFSLSFVRDWLIFRHSNNTDINTMSFVDKLNLFRKDLNPIKNGFVESNLPEELSILGDLLHYLVFRYDMLGELDRKHTKLTTREEIRILH